MENTPTQWTDATTYTRQDTDRVPTAWEYNTGMVRIYLTCGHRHHPGKWVVVCRDVGFDPVTLIRPASPNPTQTEIELAQQNAINAVKNRLKKMIASL